MIPDPVDTAAREVCYRMFRDLEETIRANTPNPDNAERVLSRLVDILDDHERYVDEVMEEAS